MSDNQTTDRYLTQAEQRIMDRALRRSLKMQDDPAQPTSDWRPQTNSERLARAQQDAYQASLALADGDYLRADILLKLAIDEIADTGLLP